MVSEEKTYFEGDGVLAMSWTEHKDTFAKADSLLWLGPLGYLAFGRDKTGNHKAQGTVVVTNRRICCGSSAYPFDRILRVTRLSESVSLTFEYHLTGITVEMEIKTRDLDALLRSLEQAKSSR